MGQGRRVDWLVQADCRVHGTTHARPIDRFDRAEREALGPLPQQPLPVLGLIRRGGVSSGSGMVPIAREPLRSQRVIDGADAGRFLRWRSTAREQPFPFALAH